MTAPLFDIPIEIDILGRTLGACLSGRYLVLARKRRLVNSCGVLYSNIDMFLLGSKTRR